MLKNYLITAIRSMLRNKLASLIAIVGLALSFACVFLLAMFIQFETSFESFHKNSDRLCRVMIRGETYSREIIYTATTTSLTGMNLANQMPEIKHTVTIGDDDIIIGIGERYFREWGRFAEPSFLDMFHFPLSQGDAQTALTRPNSMLITSTAAERFFGAANPLGQTVSVSTQRHPAPVAVTITGVLQDIPDNTVLLRDLLLSLDVYKTLQGRVDGDLHGQTYLELHPTASFATVKQAIADIHITDYWAGSNFKTYRLDLERVRDMHLYSRVGLPAGSPNYQSVLIALLLFAVILILGIACINVMNLLIAGFSKRSKEVGLRKVVGAQQRQLIGQFLVEALVLCAFAFVVALMFAEILLPQFNTHVQRHLTFNFVHKWRFWVGMFGVSLIFGLLSGLYPAFVLSALKPVNSLKGERLPSTKRLRKALVVLQFIASTVLLIGSSVITREITFLRNKPLGFATQNIVLVNVNVPGFMERYQPLKTELLQLDSVSHVTASSLAGWFGGLQLLPVMIPGIGRVESQILLVDPDYLQTYQIPLLEGDDFPKPYIASNKIIITESAKRAFGWDTIAGKSLNLAAITDPRADTGQVIGVVKDIQYFYPIVQPQPLLIVQRNDRYGMRWSYLSIRFHDNVEPSRLTQIENIWKKILPMAPFDAELLETRIEREHRNNLEPFKASLQAMTGFALCIACLGLFGLASYETNRRTKEVGIRKALGATSGEVVLHFLKSFLLLVGLANMIAWPLSFFLLRLFFQFINYPYPLRMGLLIFMRASIVSVILTILTVSAQTWRAASVNPVNALRYE